MNDQPSPSFGTPVDDRRCQTPAKRPLTQEQATFAAVLDPLLADRWRQESLTTADRDAPPCHDPLGRQAAAPGDRKK